MEAGKCPKCGADLEYHSQEEFDGDTDMLTVSFPFICECGLKGAEIYDLTISHMVDDDGNIYTQEE